ELPVPSKRMRVEGPRSASGYNVFCKEISADEDMKALSPKERFKAFAERWASLEEEDREDFARRAAALELSEADKDKKWRANMKKMVQLINIQKALKPSTEGFFILSTGVAGEEQAGGTPGGKRFLQQTEVVEGFRSYILKVREDYLNVPVSTMFGHHLLLQYQRRYAKYETVASSMFGVTKTSLEKRFYGHMSTVNTMKTKTPLGDTIINVQP
ncbi:hypothetical protein BSL78_01377, partial [Apostichopus japonicus]